MVRSALLVVRLNGEGVRGRGSESFHLPAASVGSGHVHQLYRERKLFSDMQHVFLPCLVVLILRIRLLHNYLFF